MADMRKMPELSPENRALIEGLPLRLDEEWGMGLWLDPEYAPNQSSVAITRDLLRRLCRAIQEGDKEAEGSYEIGKRDGYEEAVADLDQLTGGDGEYRFCTNHDPERHCPDVATMKARIAARFAARTEGRRAPDQGWRPIETAPKDGTEILITTAGDGMWVRIGFWDEARDGCWSVWPGRAQMWPTHWRPLPEPPGAETPDQGEEVERLREGWLPIVLCPTDGVNRALLLPDGTEVVGCYANPGGWQTCKAVAYDVPTKEVIRGGFLPMELRPTPDAAERITGSSQVTMHLHGKLPEGIYPTHFRPNDTVHGPALLTKGTDRG